MQIQNLHQPFHTLTDQQALELIIQIRKHRRTYKKPQTTTKKSSKTKQSLTCLTKQFEHLSEEDKLKILSTLE